jgi:hypothetical protein
MNGAPLATARAANDGLSRLSAALAYLPKGRDADHAEGADPCRSPPQPLVLPGGQITRSVGPALREKIFRFPSDPNHPHIPRHPGPRRGAFRDRHGRRARDAMDAACQKTNDIARGRRSRVVLTPRRWRQASRKYPRGDGGKQARSPGRARK